MMRREDQYRYRKVVILLFFEEGPKVRKGFTTGTKSGDILVVMNFGQLLPKFLIIPIETIGTGTALLFALAQHGVYPEHF